MNGITTVTGCARTIRRQPSILFEKHLNVEVGQHDILEHNDQGYRLNANIEVVFKNDHGHPDDDQGHFPDEPILSRLRFARSLGGLTGGKRVMTALRGEFEGAGLF